MNQIPANLRKK